MPDLFQRQSPLVQVQLSDPKSDAPRIEEVPFQGFINIRGSADNHQFLTGMKEILGVQIPLEPNTAAASAEYRVYWMGPDEWLVITADHRQTHVLQKLRHVLQRIASSVVDNSSGLTLLKLTGVRAVDLLQKDCPFDLHSRVFGAGQCAQTRLAKTSVLMARLKDEVGFELIVRRSFADYLLRWMQDASIEFERPR